MRYTLLVCLAQIAVSASAQPETRGPVRLDSFIVSESRSGRLSSKFEASVSVDTVGVAAALREIARQTQITVAFETGVVEREGVRPIQLNQIPAGVAIIRVLEGTPLRAFLMQDGSVVVRQSYESRGSERDTPDFRGQIVRGRVVDRITRSPLIGANVVVVDSEPLIGTTTGTDGRFVLEDVPLGRHDFRISYIGYETASIEQVLVTSGKEVLLDVLLRERVIEGEELVVIPNTSRHAARNEMALVSARSFTVEETRRYAGGLDDPARMASSFAGVATGAGIQENAVVIRGNAPKGVLWRLEGVEIPNPNHFGGITTMGAGGLTLFSSHLLANSDFLTGAFPAEYGNALAGVFDMQFRSGNPSTREHAVQLGVVGIDLASEGPFVRDGASTYLFNYRYSTLGLILPLLPTEDVASFQDLSFKLSFPTTRAGRFEVWGIGGLDAQTMSAEDDSTQWVYETWDLFDSDLRLGVGAGGVSHGIVLGRRSYLKSTVAVTANRTYFDRDRISVDLQLRDDLVVDSRRGRLIVGSYVNHKFGTRHVNRTGVGLQRLFFDVNVEAALDERSPAVAIADAQGSASLVRAYSQSQVEVSPALSLNLGAHLQHFTLTNRTALEPRLGVRWSFRPAYELSAGYGLHSQIEDLRIYFASRGDLRPNRHLPFAKAHHAVIGLARLFGETRRIKLEGYYQTLFNVAVVPDSSYSLINFEQDFLFREALQASGAGRNVGLELTIERFLADGFYYLVTGSVFDSAYRGGDGSWRPTRWDRGYTVNGLIGSEMQLGSPSSLLGLNVRISAMGGKRRSPVDHEASALAEEVVYSAERAFANREPALFLLDLTVTFRRDRGSVSDVWALQIKNALGAKETILDYNLKTDRVEEVKEGFPLPLLSYKIEF